MRQTGIRAGAEGYYENNKFFYAPWCAGPLKRRARVACALKHLLSLNFLWILY